MAEATADPRLDEAAQAEEEAVPPEPTMKAMIIGEIVGSFLLSFLGLGIGISATLWGSPDAPWFGDIWPTAAGWTMAIALGIYVTNTLSGAHFNPAITITMAATGRHPWRLVPLYIICQIIGWFIGAAALALMFARNIYDYARVNNIAIGEAGSERLGAMFTTYSPNPGIAGASVQTGYTAVPFLEGLTGEILGTAILLLVVLSLLETRHVNAPSAWFFPLIVGATVGLLIMFVAPISQASFNPARDLGPRIVLLFMGFGPVAFPGPNGGLSLVVTTVGPIIGGVLGALFFDKVMRPNIPGVDQEGPRVTSLSELAYDPTLDESREGTLSGHRTQLPPELLGEAHGIDLVMIDAGGCIYDDDPWALAVLKAARELSGSEVDEAEFWQVYDGQRQEQGGSLSRTVAAQFAPGVDPGELSELAKEYADYTVSSLYPDAEPTLEALASRYKLGVVVNPRRAQTEALERDGLMQYFDVVTHPEKVDTKAPDARMWRRALEETGVSADRAVHVGNRIDNDVRPANQAGLQTIWLLRGEAPPSPTVEQLTEPDAIVTTFSGVPNALVSIAPSREEVRVHRRR